MLTGAFKAARPGRPERLGLRIPPEGSPQPATVIFVDQVERHQDSKIAARSPVVAFAGREPHRKKIVQRDILHARHGSHASPARRSTKRRARTIAFRYRD